ncbi:GNAT family N-acetyltransferase [Naasia sp. SYSU D00948]|uniref:GNAT family N-acetyltransferase n=1 Tax=Naasia sp. SYSU D00948 TaxID=2817379 RepID=UPI001B305B60|nr:GNAT family N-acetyltransferase [Naasia sp. SYSU D00948]
MTATTITTRLATPDDADLVHLLVSEIAAHENSLDSVHATTDDWRGLLARPDVHVLLAFDRDTAIGYASMTRRLHLWTGGDILALDDLYVRQAARNRGVGRQLMTAVAQLAEPEQLLVVWGARADNEDGHRFYRRLGARIHTKAVISWTPQDYAWAVSA